MHFLKHAKPSVHQTESFPVPRIDVEFVQNVIGSIVPPHGCNIVHKNERLSFRKKGLGLIDITDLRHVACGCHQLPRLWTSVKTDQVEMSSPQAITSHAVNVTVQHKIQGSTIEPLNKTFAQILRCIR